jgi:glycoprotein endo-alpha-1,2-mannosidase
MKAMLSLNFKIALAALLISLGGLAFSQALSAEGVTAPPQIGGERGGANGNSLLYRARIVLSTSSDWTRLYIRSGERILNVKTTVLQGNAATTRVGWDKDELSLEQPLADALAKMVKVQYDLVITGLDNDTHIFFENQKGDLGTTMAEFYNYNSSSATPIAAWSNLLSESGDPANPFSFSIADSHFTTGGPLPQPHVRPRLVLAFYYPWYEPDSWSSPVLKDHPLFPYSSDDMEAIARHIQWAQQYGIHGFISSWWGSGNYRDMNFAKLLTAVQGTDFKVTIYFETLGERFRTTQDVINQLEYVLASYSDHPNFLRYRGKPVIFLYSVENVVREPGQTPLRAWRIILDQIRADGYDAVWIGHTFDPSYLEVFDGLHAYGFYDPAMPEVYSSVSGQVRTYHLLQDPNAARKIWAPGVMAGYDDELLGRPGSWYLDRAGGDIYSFTFQAAIESQADWIVITSFNEWWEHTHIEPSDNHGFTYLELTKEWSDSFLAQAPHPILLPLLTKNPSQ